MRLFLSVFALALCVPLRADDIATIAEVRAADDARVSAMIAADFSALDATLSDGLHYAHSAEGFVEDKKQHIDSLVSRRGIYQRFDFKSRDFRIVSPGVVECHGRALVEAGNPRMIFLFDINFLAVWRFENQRWKLFAWQSSRNAEMVALAPPSEKKPNKAVQPTTASLMPRADEGNSK